MRPCLTRSAALAALFLAAATAAQGAEILRCEGSGTSGIRGFAATPASEVSYYRIGPDNLETFSEEANRFQQVHCKSDWYTCSLSGPVVSYALKVPDKIGRGLVTSYEVSIDTQTGDYRYSAAISSSGFHEDVIGKCRPSADPSRPEGAVP